MCRHFRQGEICYCDCVERLSLWLKYYKKFTFVIMNLLSKVNEHIVWTTCTFQNSWNGTLESYLLHSKSLIDFVNFVVCL